MFRAVQAKDVPALRELARQARPQSCATALQALPELYGGIDVLGRARERLPEYPEIRQALANCGTIARGLPRAVPNPCFDLG